MEKWKIHPALDFSQFFMGKGQALPSPCHLCLVPIPHHFQGWKGLGGHSPGDLQHQEGFVAVTPL